MHPISLDVLSSVRRGSHIELAISAANYNYNHYNLPFINHYNFTYNDYGYNFGSGYVVHIDGRIINVWFF